MNKPYDAELDDASKIAEWSVVSWLMDSGFTVTDHPQGPTGPDVLVARLGRAAEQFVVEVEHMGANRTNEIGDVSFATISVLSRRKMSATLNTLIFHVTNDLKYVHIVFDRDFLAAPVTHGNSSNFIGCEGKKYVDRERVLKVKNGSLIDQPFADMNVDRVRAALEHETDPRVVRKYLGGVRPYGMHAYEWHRYLGRLNDGSLPVTHEDQPF